MKAKLTPGARVRRSAVAATIGACIGNVAFADDNVDAMRQQLQRMQDRIEQLERDKAQRDSQAPRSIDTQAGNAAGIKPGDAPAVTAGAVKGSFKLPATDTSMAIGGYVKGSMVYSSRSSGPANAGDLVLLPQTIPLNNAAFPPGRRQQGEVHRAGVAHLHPHFHTVFCRPRDFVRRGRFLRQWG